MKGIVFSMKNHKKIFGFTKQPKRITAFSFKRFWTYYSVQVFFALCFFVGIVFGSRFVSTASADFLKKIDFLFLTNLQSRLELSAFEIFSASFASDFIFILLAFLSGLSAWGIFSLSFLCAFKGIGVGISSMYLYSQYSITGIGFYILVVLPGTVLFFFAFICALREAFTQSLALFRILFSSETNLSMSRYTKTYLFRNGVVVVFTMFSSVINMILWVLFANMFNFK